MNRDVHRLTRANVFPVVCELCPEKANRLHDDRAYVTCMCSYALQTERRKNITAKRKPKVDKSLVQKLTIRKGVVRSMFET